MTSLSSLCRDGCRDGRGAGPPAVPALCAARAPPPPPPRLAPDPAPAFASLPQLGRWRASANGAAGNAAVVDGGRGRPPAAAATDCIGPPPVVSRRRSFRRRHRHHDLYEQRRSPAAAAARSYSRHRVHVVPSRVGAQLLAGPPLGPSRSGSTQQADGMAARERGGGVLLYHVAILSLHT
jgi:hypothetical protein